MHAPRRRSSATARARSSRSPRPAAARSSRPSSTCPSATACCPSASAAREPARLPEIAEPEIVRHYNRLSKRNFDLDTGFYPLGSCTMKHNPKLHERVAALPGHARLHPLQHPRARPGRAAADVGAPARARRDRRACRTSRCSRAPGSHGELAGVLLTRAYHEDRGEQPHEGAHARHRARHEPGDGDDGAATRSSRSAPNARGGVDVDDLQAPRRATTSPA